MKTECDFLCGWINKRFTYEKKISPKIVNPRDLAGNAVEEEEEFWHFRRLAFSP